MALRFIKLFAGKLFIGLSLLLIAGIVVSAALLFYFSRDLPSISSLKNYKPPVISSVYAEDGSLIGEFFKERRIVIPLKEMPEQLVQAFLAAEDARFFQHRGIDPMGILRAFIKNIKASGIVQGGSTITQQVAKSFFLSPERSYTRKIREIILAYKIEKYLEKEEILYLYLNQIYLGHGAYGVESAAENYFGCSAKNLNLAQAAMLAGLPQAPSRYSPFRNPVRAKERQRYVLSRMIESRIISQKEAEKAEKEILEIYPRQNIYMEASPYYTEHIRQYVLKEYGEKALYEDGLSIYTALDTKAQKEAEKAIETGLLDLDKRQGYRGALETIKKTDIERALDIIAREEKEKAAPGQLRSAIVIETDNKKGKTLVRFAEYQGEIPIESMRWARKPNPDVAYYNARVRDPEESLSEGDRILIKLIKNIKDNLWEVRLEQVPIAQAALLCMEANTGYVRAMMGGRDFKSSQFNRSIQARRQAGSAFKPFIYAAALDKGYTPASIIVDNASVYRSGDFTWKPRNYENTFSGPKRLREALATSNNLITIKILESIGLNYTLEYIKKLGLSEPVNKDLSIALGSSGHSLLELVNAYAVFAQKGRLFEPVFIKEIRDREGRIIEKNLPFYEEAISEETAYLMTSLLESVVSSGTGWRARKLINKGWPTAAKTGTTNKLNDAWFIGYTPAYITGVWVGFDEEASLGESETGSRAAAPIWLDFMENIHKELKPEAFPPPTQNITTVKIDTDTGLLAIPESEKTSFEYFKKGSEPKEFTLKAGEIEDEKDFFKQGL